MSATPTTLAELLKPYLAEQCEVIMSGDARIRAGENVVHVTRVGVRRLRSTIRVFDDAFDSEAAAHLEQELVWWANLLGAVRDVDIMGDRLRASLGALSPDLVLGPVALTIESELAARRRSALAAVLEALDSQRYRDLIGLLHRWQSEPPFTSRSEAPARVVKRYVKRAGAKLQKRLNHAIAADRAGNHQPELFHSARKAGKRHRYAIEAALPLWGEKAERLVAERKDLQDLLGDYQDSIVSAAFLRELSVRYGLRSGHNGFTYGLLYAEDVAAGRELGQRLAPYV